MYMHIAVIFHLLSVFPSHLRLSNGQAKVRYGHNALAMFCGVRDMVGNEGAAFSNRVLHFASSLRGTGPYWFKHG